jgi:SAM-dependent methyltransferase
LDKNHGKSQALSEGIGVSQSVHHESSPSILFVNQAVENCGVYQYGKNLFSVLEGSRRYKFHYLAASGLKEIAECASKLDCGAILYNYHPQTLRYLNPHSPRVFKPINIAIMHEMTQAEADEMPNGFFQYYVMGDPTLVERNPNVFSTGRIIFPYVNKNPLPAIPTIGTFGFSVASKGYQRLIEIVEKEFDEAVVRLHIPSNGIVDPKGAHAEQQIKLCYERLTKPKVKIEVSRKFLSQDELLDYIGGNTINVFPYDHLKVAGISSSADHAMAVGRPFAITKSIMFRHLHSVTPSIALEDNTLKQIIANGTAPFDHLVKQWSPSAMIARYEQILDTVRSRGDVTTELASDAANAKIQPGASLYSRGVARVVRDSYRIYQVARNGRRFLKRVSHRYLGRYLSQARKTSYNRILDDSARIRYARVSDKIRQLVPFMMASLNQEASVRQAFVLDAVEGFSKDFTAPKILCIGSHNDTAAASLKKMRVAFEEVDPVGNGLDLNAFIQLPTTRMGTYDIVFSTSMIDRTHDDEQFLKQVVGLLGPRGVAILTCDFNDEYKAGAPVVEGNFRFYTKRDLTTRILPLLEGCALVDEPNWDCSHPDFEQGGIRYTFASLVFRKSNTIVIEQDWASMSVQDQARFFFENGFVVVPGAISSSEAAGMVEEIKRAGITKSGEDIWGAASLLKLIENPKVVPLLQLIYGEEIRFFKGAYSITPPLGIPGKRPERNPLHVDYGIGERTGDFRNSCACWVNIGFYLTDLTPECAPLWVVPRSQLILNKQTPEAMDTLNKDARMVLAKAGDAVLFHCFTSHASSLNVSETTRHALFYSYRPSWAKPIGLVAEWSQEFIDQAPLNRRWMLEGLNKGIV